MPKYFDTRFSSNFLELMAEIRRYMVLYKHPWSTSNIVNTSLLPNSNPKSEKPLCEKCTIYI